MIVRFSKKTIVISSVLLIAALFILLVIIVPLLRGRKIDLAGADYRVKEVLYDTYQNLTDENETNYKITSDYGLYVKHEENGDWQYLGEMEAYPLTKGELKKYTMYKAGWVARYNHHGIADAYILRVKDNFFYLAFKTVYGEILLAYGWEDVSERNEYGSDDTWLSWLSRLDNVNGM